MTMKAGKIWGQTELIHANGVLEFHRIEYKAGYKCSEHEHKYKWNGFFVESGKMIVRVWQDADQEGLVDETILGPGEFTQVTFASLYLITSLAPGIERLIVASAEAAEYLILAPMPVFTTTDPSIAGMPSTAKDQPGSDFACT